MGFARGICGVLDGSGLGASYCPVLWLPLLWWEKSDEEALARRLREEAAARRALSMASLAIATA